MALGKKLFQWDASDMIKGMSTSDDLADGGFSPNTDAVNLIASPGIAYSPASPTDKSTNVAGEIIASCEDPQFLGSDRVFVDDEGQFYTWNGTTMTLARTDTTPNNYVQGKTDMAAFDGSVFATSDDTLVKWTVDSSFSATFVTGLNANVPHPLLNFENFLYIADGNLLKRINDASDSTPDTMLTLSSLQTIVALSIDPGSGKMLISTTQALNLSSTRSNTNKVLYYDGFSNKVMKVVPVDDMITAFPFTEGQLYAAYGQNLGIWNGAGVTFLRKFDLSFSNESLLYKQHFTSNGPTLYFIEGRKIIAHGPIRESGEKVFYPAFKNQVNSNSLTHIANLGQNILGMAFATDKFYTWSITSTASSNTQDLYSNEYEFDNELWIRWIRIIYKNQISNNVDPGSLRLYDQDGLITAINPAQSGIIDLRNTSGAASAVKDLLNINYRAKQIQFELLLDTVNPGIRRIIFYGELANLP